MLRMVNLVDDDDSSRSTEVVAYRSGDQIMIAINVEGRCLARVFVPAIGNVKPVGAELAESWPRLVEGKRG